MKSIHMCAAAALMLIAAACRTDLTVENLSNPDIARVFATGASIEATIGSGYQTVHNSTANQALWPETQMLGLETYSSLNNFNMGVRVAIPRPPISNSNGAPSVFTEFSNLSKQARLMVSALDAHAAPSHRMITNFVAHRSVVEFGDFSPDGKLFVTASYDHSLRLWETAHWRELATFQGHLDVIFSVVFSGDGTRIASASVDGTVRFWSATPSPRENNHKDLPADVRQWSLSPDGQRLFLIFADQTFSLWDLATWGESARKPLGSTNITAAALFAGGRRVALGDSQGRVAIHDISIMEGMPVSGGFEGAEVIGLSCSADGSTLVGHATNHLIIAWSAATGVEIARFTSELNPQLHGLPISKDGRTVAAAPMDGTVELWKLPSLRKRSIYVSDIEPVTDVAFFGDGRRVATTDPDKTARIWDLTAPERPLVTMYADLTALMCVALSPDEHRLAAGEDVTQPRRVKVWDVATGQELAGLTGHKWRISDVAFWPDGNTIVSVSKDAVFVWRGASIKEIDAKARAK